MGVYDVYGQHGGYSMALVFRTDLPQASLVPALRQRLAQFDDDAPLYSVGSGDDMARQTVADKRTVLALLAVFASVAFALAIIGLYGVVAQTVRTHKRSYGIRLALGAKRHQLLGQVLASSGLVTLLGLAAGIAGARLLSQSLRELLYGVQPLDLHTYALAGFLFVLTAVATTAWPVWKATTIDPASILRDD